MTGSSNRVLVAVAALGGAVLVVGILAIAGVFSDDDDDGGADEEFGTPTVTAEAPPPPPSEPTVNRIPVGGRPDSISAGAGFVWIGDSLGGTPGPPEPTLWTAPRSGRATQAAPSPALTSVGKPATGSPLGRALRGLIRLSEPQQTRGFPFQIAAGEGAVWAMSQKAIERLDPGSGRPGGQPTPLEGSGSSIAAGTGWVWVTRSNREVVRISPDDGELSQAAAGVPGAFSVAVGESAVWALGAGGTLARIDPEGGEASGTPVRVPQALDVAAGLGAVWVTAGDGSVSRFDPATGAAVGKPIRVGRQPQSISIGEGAVWVACAGDGSVYRITPA